MESPYRVPLVFDRSLAPASYRLVNEGSETLRGVTVLLDGPGVMYIKADGMPAMYSPDFLIRTEYEVFVVETKAQSALSDANVQRKLGAAKSWCDRINALPAEIRGHRSWHYALLGEKNVKEWKLKGMSATNLLRFSKVAASGSRQFDLFDE